MSVRSHKRSWVCLKAREVWYCRKGLSEKDSATEREIVSFWPLVRRHVFLKTIGKSWSSDGYMSRSVKSLFLADASATFITTDSLFIEVRFCTKDLSHEASRLPDGRKGISSSSHFPRHGDSTEGAVSLREQTSKISWMQRMMLMLQHQIKTRV